jgi:hypothetical protein
VGKDVVSIVSGWALRTRVSTCLPILANYMRATAAPEDVLLQLSTAASICEAAALPPDPAAAAGMLRCALAHYLAAPSLPRLLAEAVRIAAAAAAQAACVPVLSGALVAHYGRLMKCARALSSLALSKPAGKVTPDASRQWKGREKAARQLLQAKFRTFAVLCRSLAGVASEAGGGGAAAAAAPLSALNCALDVVRTLTAPATDATVLQSAAKLALDEQVRGGAVASVAAAAVALLGFLPPPAATPDPTPDSSPAASDDSFSDTDSDAPPAVVSLNKSASERLRIFELLIKKVERASPASSIVAPAVENPAPSQSPSAPPPSPAPPPAPATPYDFPHLLPLVCVRVLNRLSGVLLTDAAGDEGEGGGAGEGEGKGGGEGEGERGEGGLPYPTSDPLYAPHYPAGVRSLGYRLDVLLSKMYAYLHDLELLQVREAGAGKFSDGRTWPVESKEQALALYRFAVRNNPRPHAVRNMCE